jgi:HAD superfamily hydrolase (TIGR01509 family)
LFDFDGVLADTEPIYHACWQKVIEPLGIQLDWAYYRKHCVGITEQRMVRLLVEGDRAKFEAIWSQYPRKQEMFRAELARNPPFLPETIALIPKLQEKHRLAVVSSSHRDDVAPLLAHVGIQQCFEALVCGREVQNLKPAPDPYLKAAELLGARRPLVIEDSDAGVASGKAAGFEVLRVSDARVMASELLLHLKNSGATS